MPYNFTPVERKWQDYWLKNKSFRALDPGEAGGMPKKYVLDMFPYPSGAGLHVGHPEGYTATDIYSRYLRMKGFNVLHAMGWDAFGLPAEQYAIQNNVQPAVTTRKNIDNFRRQIRSLGLSYDWDREIDTTDPRYYRWTQWIFLRLYDSYFDPFDNKAKPVGHLVAELNNENLLVAPDGSIHINPTQEGLESIYGDASLLRTWKTYDPAEQRGIIDGLRLAYIDDVPVWWCAGLGTVLANEEVIDGRSERGNYPVERRPMRQWMLRITSYADRLIDDLDALDWPVSIKEMQRNWIGRSSGAEVDFELASATPADGGAAAAGGPGEEGAAAEEGAGEGAGGITVFTTRPDTLFGATYMVLAPEHALVDRITTPQQQAAVDAYRQQTTGRSERERMADAKEKTGVFTGAYAINPVNDERIPVWIADYVLTGYGTGAIMAVPAHDERDFAFARKFGLPIRRVVTARTGNQEAAGGGDGSKDLDEMDRAWVAEGMAVNSGPIDGLTTAEAKAHMLDLLEREGTGRRTINYKLRDWLFSRQRYWGEPFPILLDVAGNHYAVDDAELPVELPEMTDFKPTGTPEPPLSKATDWVTLERAGRVFTRETNTMPQWAGSCWYYLRFTDPENNQAFVDEEKERYWLPVDLYVGGVEHAVLHLLYSRFWHKVLFDLDYVQTPEPFQKLVNQGLILGEVEYHFFEDDAGRPISATEFVGIDEEPTDRGVRMFGTHKPTGRKLYATRVIEALVEKQGGQSVLKANPAIVVDARSFKMSKSRGNVVNPDSIVQDYGADCFRLYEMYMGPLEAQKPWNTRDIIGMHRFLNRIWLSLVGDEEAGRTAVISGEPIPDALDRQLQRTIKKVGEDIENLRFNTAIAELIKLNNELAGLDAVPRALAEAFVLLLAPFVPHIAEELWHRLGNDPSLARRAWPEYDASKLVESEIELPVQVNGKLRDRLLVPPDVAEAAVFEKVEASEKVRPWIQGKTVVKRVYVSQKMVNYVVK